MNSLRIFLPKAPKSIVLKNSEEETITPKGSSWDANSRTYYLNFENSPEGIQVFFQL